LANSRGVWRKLARFFRVKVTIRELLSDNHAAIGRCDNGFQIGPFFRIQIWEKFTVLDRFALSAADRVAALVQKILAKRAIECTVAHEDALTDIGLSSLDMVNLMLAVEAEFDVKIPDSNMTPENFRSVARIAALVESLPEQA